MLSVDYGNYVIVAANMMTGLWLKSCMYIWNFKQLKSRSGSLEAKEIARLARSFMPLKFHVGGVYYMEKETKLSLLKFLITDTLNILLVLK